MGFAQEIRDFTAAFGAVSQALGTRSSREAARLDNEYRRAQIDYMNARTGEIAGQGADFTDFTAGYNPPPLDLTPGATAAEGGAGSTTGTAVTPGAGLSSPLATPPAVTGKGVTVPGPKGRPTRTATGTVVPTPKPKATAGVSDLPGTEAIAGTNIADAGVTPEEQERAIRQRAAETAAQHPHGAYKFKVAIGDRTSMRGVQPRTIAAMQRGQATAEQMGIRLVVTAGAGGGHLSHGSGSEIDFIGYRADGSKWNHVERARIIATMGFNRIGLYPGMSAHGGFSGDGRPSAMWGAGGLVRGPASRQYTNSADQSLLKAFNSGQLFGGAYFSQDFFPTTGEGAEATSGYDVMDRARRAIQSIESVGSGGYAAVNKRSGALGAYQVMPANLPEWSQAALGRVVTPAEFLANPSIQDQIFDHRFGGYVEKFGTLQDAASAWFTGQPLGAGGATASDYNITGQQYVDKFNKAMNLPGGAGPGGGFSGSVGVDRGVPGAVDDLPPYPEPAEQAGGQVPTGDKVHDVQPGDTLWDIANKYNVDDYMDIVKANPEIADPDLIYPEQDFVIPGAVDIDVPTPVLRPALEPKKPPAEQNPATSSTANTMAVPNPPARPDQHPTSSTGDTVDIQPNIRPAGGPGGTPPTNYTPSEGSHAAELQRAQQRREQVATDTTMPPATRDAMVRALDVKIQQLSGKTGGTGSSTPTETARPVLQRPGLDAKAKEPYKGANWVQEHMETIAARKAGPGTGPVRRGEIGALDMGTAEEPIASADPEALNAAGMTPPTPLRAPVNRDKLTGSDAGFATAAPGSGAVDELGPAQASINEVTNRWTVSADGHIVTPDGRKTVRDSYEDGKHAVREGSDWLVDAFFPGNDPALDEVEDNTPDDGTPSAAGAYVNGRFSLKKSEVAQAHQVIRGWAEKNGVELSESELHMRTAGLLYGYYVTSGQSQKAVQIAAAYLQYMRVRYGQYSAIAQAALEAGDTEAAVEAAVKAYAQIPDGRDIQVTGDAQSGYVMSYINEETGKRISKKVLSPNEMGGMIMGMAPDDFDKFLVKAAGEEELPELSEHLQSALDRLNSTPPDQRPVYDAKAAAYMDSRELQIYTNAFNSTLTAFKEGPGYKTPEQIAYEQDLAALGMGGGGGAVPATPAAPAATGTPVAPTTGGTAGTAAPAAPGPTGTPAAPAPGTPAAPVTPEVTGGSIEIAPGIRTPGADGTFGLGPAPDLNVPRFAQLRSSRGMEVAKAEVEVAQRKWKADYDQRATAYANFAARGGDISGKPPVAALDIEEGRTKDDTAVPPPPPATMRTPIPAAGPDALSPEAARLVTTAPGLIPDFPKTMVEQFGMRPAEDPEVAAAAARDPTGAASAYYTSTIKARQEAYDILKTKVDAEYAEATDIPKPAEWTETERSSATALIQTQIDTPPDKAPQDETDHINANKGSIDYVAQTIGQLNSLGENMAVEQALSMMVADQVNPSMPRFVAIQHPIHPSYWLVQPLGLDDRPDGPELIIPDNAFQTILQTWQQHADTVIAARNQENAGTPWKGAGEANTAPRGPNQPIRIGAPVTVTEHPDVRTPPPPPDGAPPVPPNVGGLGVPFIPGRGAVPGPGGYPAIDLEPDPTYVLPTTNLPFNPRGAAGRYPALPLD
jgi:LysM repeat protein